MHVIGRLLDIAKPIGLLSLRRGNHVSIDTGIMTYYFMAQQTALTPDVSEH